MTAPLLALIVFSGLALWGALLAYQWWRTLHLADSVREARVSQGALSPDVRPEDFRAVFLRAEGPRLNTYIFASGVISVGVLPVTVFLFNTIWLEIWNVTGRISWSERGSLVYAIMLIFVYSAVFFGVAWFTMQRYHRQRPPTLRAEIRRLNGERT